MLFIKLFAAIILVTVITVPILTIFNKWAKKEFEALESLKEEKEKEKEEYKLKII